MLQTRQAEAAAEFQKPAIGDMQEYKRRTDASSVSLRRNKRFEHVNKTRQKINDTDGAQEMLKQAIPQLFAEGMAPEVVIEIFVNGLKASQSTEMTEALLKYTQNLVGRQQFTYHLTSIGLGPMLLEFLKLGVAECLTIAAMQWIAHIANWNIYTTIFPDIDVVESLAEVLQTGDSTLVEPCLSALASIAEDGKSARDSLIANNVLSYISSFISNCRDFPASTHFEILRVLYGCSRYLGEYDSNEIEDIIKDVSRLIENCDISNYRFLNGCIMVITQVLRVDIQPVINQGLIHNVLKYLQIPDDEVQVACLRALTNLSSGDDLQCHILFKDNQLDIFQQFLQMTEARKRAEVCTIISNLVCCSDRMVRVVSDHSIMKQISLMAADTDWAVRREASHIYANATHSKLQYFISRLLELDVLDNFEWTLNDQDPTTLSNTLRFFNYLFENQQIFAQSPQNYEEFSEVFESLGYVEKIEKVQGHPNEQVYTMAAFIIKNYFSGADLSLEDQVEISENK